MQTHAQPLNEEVIADLVRVFYQRAAADPQLQEIFNSVIADWDEHHRIVQDFWSKVLLDTTRYQGHPYPLHTRLPINLEHFDIWLGYFRETATELLPSAAAKIAIARAEMMAESFKTGMFLDYMPTSMRS